MKAKNVAFYVHRRRQHMELVAIVVAHQGSQVSRGALVPGDQQEFRDHLALRDPWDHEEIKATMANQEAKARQAPRDLKGPRAQWDHKELKVTQVRKEAKALQAQRGIQAHGEVTGNSVCLKIWTTTRTQDWSR